MSSLSTVVVKRLTGLKPHPNADNLLMTELDGLPVIVNKNELRENDLILLTPFDIIPPDENWVPDFARNKRIRPMRLRGIFSMAVCLPLPEGDWQEGQDVTETLGFTKWIPPHERDDGPDGIQLENSKNGYSCAGPSGLIIGKYDLDSLRKYHKEFTIGEEVVFTAKLDGENIAIVYWNDCLYVRSRTRWITEGDNKWWIAVRQYNWDFLKKYPGYVVFGEKYGNVNKFRYDCKNGEQRIRVFDVFNANTMSFLDYEDFYNFPFDISIEAVPVLYRGPWLGLDQHKDITEDKAILGGDIEEGFVAQTVKLRWTAKGERMKWKYHSEKYLLHKGKLK